MQRAANQHFNKGMQVHSGLALAQSLRAEPAGSTKRGKEGQEQREKGEKGEKAKGHREGTGEKEEREQAKPQREEKAEGSQEEEERGDEETRERGERRGERGERREEGSGCMGGQNNDPRFTSPKEEVHIWQSYETMAVGPGGTTIRTQATRHSGVELL